jgi:GNAT superfamily N-acetyltransferase
LTLKIEPLGKQHERSGFTCGQPELDNWFRKQASQDERRNVARVFVAVDDEPGIVGFYSLGAFTLTFESLPDEIARKLPRYDAIPAALIGRLARDEKVRGRGIGELLLADAVRRILGASKTLAVFAIAVDAKDARAVRFYEAFGFRVFPLQPRRLFLLASTAATAIAKI